MWRFLVHDKPVITAVLPAPRRPAERPRFSLFVDGDRPVVAHVRGSVDHASAPQLQACVDRHGSGPHGFVLDLRGVDFLAVPGLSLLVELARQERPLVVVANTRAVTRPLRVFEVPLRVYAELPEAVSALA